MTEYLKHCIDKNSENSITFNLVNDKYLMLKSQIMLSLGFSPCPNDTFIFHAIVNKKIDTKGIDFEILIKDVEILNHLAIKKQVDVTKISCHAFYYLKDDYQFLKAGGAFGKKCGPLLVQRKEDKRSKKDISKLKIAIPGELTTAFLLLKLYLASTPNFKLKTLKFIAMPFYKIMEAVRDKKVDAGLIIHESRFTYHEYGLEKIIDLGEWWEAETGLLIPLGGIIAKKSFEPSTIETIENLIKASIKYSMCNMKETLFFIKKYSQELSDDVIMRHIALFVNDYTLDMGDEGKRALNELILRANNLYKNKTP